MASTIPIFRGAVRLSSRTFKYHGATRRIHYSPALSAAQNFTMPAMSPTMTEGNIASWKVKEGDSYSAGDVLLEIETDKAQMDVEAQEDGILAKIIQPDGSKAVKVGARIAVCAEPGDDLSSLEIPAEDSSKPQQSTQETKSSDPPTASPPKEEAQPASEDREEIKPASTSDGSKKHGNRAYPLYPSVIQLLHVNGISESDAAKISATGPGGRLLKGDVLAYMGSIDESYPKKQSEMIEKLAKLDLSNINIVAKDPSAGKAAPPEQSTKDRQKTEEVAAKPNAELTITVSLSTVTEVQQRISKTLGIDIPLSEFISRAIAVSNADLPGLSRAPTADELFDQVLGLDRIPRTEDGHFNPAILTMPPVLPSSTSRLAPKSDIIDILTGEKSTPARPSKHTVTAPSGGAAHVFVLSVPKEEEKRAKVFLERVKTTLQVNPGSLVL